MTGYIFNRSVLDLPRPKNVIEDQTKVYNLNQAELEAKVRKKLLENDRVTLVQVTESTGFFEVDLTFDHITFSVYRSKNQSDAESTYNRAAHVMNPLISTSCVPRGDITAAASFVQVVMDMVLNQPDWTVAHIAARLGKAAPFREKSMLFLKHINICTGKKKRTVLRNAILSGSEETVAAVLDCNPDLDIRDARGAHALYHAAALPNHRIFLMVLEKYKKKHKNNLDFLRVRDEIGLTTLHIACYAEQYNNITSLLAMGLPMDILILSRPRSIIFTDHQMQLRNRETSQRRSEEEEAERKRRRHTTVKFTEEMLEDIDWDEVKLGGCPIFWTTKTIFLNKMLELNFPNDIVNFCFETAVHVMARRKNLSNLLILLCNGSPQLSTLASRNTPLHQAVKSCDMSVVQALIAFDADVNAVNSQGENPRHLTGKLPREGKGNGDQILHILCSLGAHRCTQKRPDCYPGCEPGGTFDGIKDTNWPDVRNSTFYTKSLMAGIVEAALSGDVGTENILCCDGGGTKGLITCQILVELQRNLSHPIHEYFQWISGTSTGSFIAACLSLGMDVRTIRKHYLMLKDEIISGDKPYPSEPIERFCKSLLGPNRKMSDIKNHKLIIAGCLADRSPPQLHLFRSYMRWEDDKSESKSLLYDFVDADPHHKDWKSWIEHLWFACRASAAAPFYFAPIGPFIDGGVIAANPTQDTISEFMKYQSRQEKKERLGVVVSLGTGKWPIEEHPMLVVGRMSVDASVMEYPRMFPQLVELAKTVGGACTNTDSYVVDRGQTMCLMGKIPFFRISPPLSFQLELDCTSDADLVNAMYETKVYLHAVASELPALISLLQLSRKKKITHSQK